MLKNTLKELADTFETHLSNYYWVVAKNEEFLELTADSLAVLLERDDLNADEESVFNSLRRWVSLDQAARTQHLPSLLPKVRLGCLQLTFLQEKEQFLALACQGDKGARDFLKEVKAYFADPTRCQERPPFAVPRNNEVIIAICGERRALECYNPRTDTWTTLNTLKNTLAPGGRSRRTDFWSYGARNRYGHYQVSK